MNVLRTDYRGRGMWGKVAAALNAVGRAINEIGGEDGIEVYAAGERIRIRVDQKAPDRRPYFGKSTSSVSHYDHAICDISHLGHYIRDYPSTVPYVPENGKVAISAPLKIWAEIDLEYEVDWYETDQEYAIPLAAKVQSGAAWPTTKLIYRLLEIDADGLGTCHRTAWVDRSVEDEINLRFETVIGPDVPLGTIVMWHKLLDIPLGWETYLPLESRFPVGRGGVQGGVGTQGGAEKHSHKPGAASSLTLYAPPYAENSVYHFANLESSANLVTTEESHIPPCTVVNFIIRVAIT